MAVLVPENCETCPFRNTCPYINRLDDCPLKEAYKRIDDAIRSLECIMESDTRSLLEPESEDGWFYDKMWQVMKILKGR